MASLLGVLAVAGVAVQGAMITSTVPFESVPVLPDRWQLHSAPQSLNDKIVLAIALKQAGISQLKARLDQISNPRSSDYGQHLSKHDVQSLIAPPAHAADSVLSWLESKGIVGAVQTHDWIRFNATVGDARSLLEADLDYYSYDGKKPVLRARSYTLPANLTDLIEFVHPITNFMPPSSSRLVPAPVRGGKKFGTRQDQADPSEQPCFGGTYPGCIKKLYNLNYSAPEGPSPVRFGIAGFLEQYINYQDTATFMEKWAPEIHSTGYNFTVELINGGENPQTLRSAGMEASLDVQYAMALGYPTNIVYYSTAGRGVKLDDNGEPYPIERTDNEPYVEFIEALLAKPDEELPHVISISYADDEIGVPRPYAIRTCDLLAALTARGVSILAASGDGGARGTGQRKCLSNDGQNRPMTMPTFPSSCPYVTTVGATSNAGGDPFPGASFSTGGFSNYFERPKWQDEAVKKHITVLNGTLEGYYSASGRAFPDISAIGSGFTIEWGGGNSSVLGTSASCPVVASMVALVNDARLRAGKSPTGWLNPMLYSEYMQSSGALHDVVFGTSQSCVWNGDVPGGWPATPGFDLITGLGVPGDFQKFLKAFMDVLTIPGHASPNSAPQTYET